MTLPDLRHQKFELLFVSHATGAGGDRRAKRADASRTPLDALKDLSGGPRANPG